MASDLISRKAALNIVDNEWYKYKDKDGLFEIAACTLMKSLFDDIERIEAVDAEPVRHGEWENYPSHSYRRCSICKMEWEKPRFNTRSNYCPNCGAKMDGGKQGG